MKSIGIVMNGVTGRMGTNQHLLRSIVAIRGQGGVPLSEGGTLMPEPVLVGRNAEKLRALSDKAGGCRWTTELEPELEDPANEIYFDAQLTDLRESAVRKAIQAGKQVYCEKPVASNLADALELYRLAEEAGIKHGVVQDKLWLPGLLKLRNLIQSGFFGRILSVRGEFGYWVFTGEDGISPQRPSWNYRKEEGGGIILDMLCHWRYVLDNLFGPVSSVSCLGATHIPRRLNEQGESYECTADDAAYACLQLQGGVVAQFNSSWCVRVRRDDLLTLQVDGTEGSAVAGLRECRVQPRSSTPRPVWNPDVPSPIDFWEGWSDAPALPGQENAFKAQWELFLRHVALGEPFPWNLREGAKGVQLAELGLESWRTRAWVDVPDLPIYRGPAS
ncbi:MAG TPA: Gfo/Idh/MocA family oxidoreductase [Fimbriimonas sp.]|nr:Gfo/Idh/MocA family oxidoreductase [Fimbriimonas sp.]